MKAALKILLCLVGFNAAAQFGPNVSSFWNTNIAPPKTGFYLFTAPGSITYNVPAASLPTTNVYYFVDVTNGVDSIAGGSAGTPFKTIGYAASNTPPRSWINVNAGLYPETISRAWGEKVYNFSKNAIVIGYTNLLPTAPAINFTTVNYASNNWPFIILGRGQFVNRSDPSGYGTIGIDNGSMDIEAERIENLDPTGHAIEVQGDDSGTDDPKAVIIVRRAQIIGDIWANEFSYDAAGAYIEVHDCSIISSNREPFSFDNFITASAAKAIKIVLSGVESRSPQTNTLSSFGYGSRIFGSMIVATNLDPTVDAGNTQTNAYVYTQYFEPVHLSGIINSDGGQMTNNSFYAATTMFQETSFPTNSLINTTTATRTNPAFVAWKGLLKVVATNRATTGGYMELTNGAWFPFTP